MKQQQRFDSWAEHARIHRGKLPRSTGLWKIWAILRCRQTIAQVHAERARMLVRIQCRHEVEAEVKAKAKADKLRQNLEEGGRTIIEKEKWAGRKKKAWVT